MLGLLLIYFIGKYFYNLAKDHDKNKWLYTILGIVIYYAGTMIAGFITGILYTLMSDQIYSGNGGSDLLLGIAMIPFGLAACWGFYTILKNKWQKETVVLKEGIDDIGKPTEDI